MEQTQRPVLEQRTEACPQCGRMLSARGPVERIVETLVGAIRLRRPSCYCERCQLGHAPLGAVLGLTNRRTQPDVHKAVVKLTKEMPSETACELFEEWTGWPLSADFKGHFKMGDGHYGYPLTITDSYSRFLLSCQALSSTSVAEAKPVFMRVFKGFGLPRRIRTDNGVPFATNTLARLSQLSAWSVRLGILPEFIEPGKPQQNGRPERMHRTLKADPARPPEALDMRTPAACYEPSPRAMPHQLPPLEYPDRFELRYVSANGDIQWHRQGVNVSTTCAGADVGLDDIDDGVWNVYFGPLKLGRRLEPHMRIEDA